MKEMCHIKNKDTELFDYMYNNNTTNIITENFFIKSNVFHNELSQSEKINYLIEYLNKIHKVLSAVSIHKIFADLQIDFGFTEQDYENIFKVLFNKPYINLCCEKDKERFRGLLEGKDIEELME